MTDDGRIDCRQFDDNLEAYVDGVVEAGVARSIETHAAGCAACTAELAAARTIATTLRRLPRLEPPASAVARVLVIAREEQVAGGARGSRLLGFRWPKPRPVWTAIAAAALLALVLFAVRDRRVGVAPRAYQADEAAVARATLETKLALAHLGRVNRRVGRGLGEDLVRRRLVRPVARSISEVMTPQRSDEPPSEERG